jgi:hypothetical protein
MRAHVFVDGSNDEQATTLHETGTGEPRHLGPVHGVARRFPPFSHNDWITGSHHEIQTKWYHFKFQRLLCLTGR